MWGGGCGGEAGFRDGVSFSKEHDFVDFEGLHGASREASKPDVASIHKDGTTD